MDGSGLALYTFLAPLIFHFITLTKRKINKIVFILFILLLVERQKEIVA